MEHLIHPEENMWIDIDDLLEVCEPLGNEHIEFMEGLQLEEALGYVYGVLLEEGADADLFFDLSGIVESEGETE